MLLLFSSLCRRQVPPSKARRVVYTFSKSLCTYIEVRSVRGTQEEQTTGSLLLLSFYAPPSSCVLALIFYREKGTDRPLPRQRPTSKFW